MTCFFSKQSFAVVFGLLFVGSSYALAAPEMKAAEGNETILVQETILDDLYSAGNTIVISADVQGDAVIAGNEIVIEKNIEQDAIVAGRSIQINGSVGDDVRVAGQDIRINGDIGDDIFAAGLSIEITNVNVGGSVFATGESVKLVNIQSTEGIEISAEKIFFDSAVTGSVSLDASEIRFGDNAQINGDLSYAGTIITESLPENITSGSVTKKEKGYVKHEKEGNGFFFFWGYAMSIFVFSLLLYVFIPQFFIKAGKNVCSTPVQSFFLGWGWFILAPIVSVLLMITVLGLPVGLFLLGIWGLLFIVFPYICSAVLAGIFLDKMKWTGFLKTVLVLFISSIVVVIPFVMVVIAPFLIGGLMKEEWNIFSGYRK